MGALALLILLAQIGCGSDPLCPLGTDGSTCEPSGALGSPPDVPTGADSANDGSTISDTNDVASDQGVGGPDTHMTDGSSSGAEDASGSDTDRDTSAEGAGDQTPDASSSDDSGHEPDDAARVWVPRLRAPTYSRDAAPARRRS